MDRFRPNHIALPPLPSFPSSPDSPSTSPADVFYTPFTSPPLSPPPTDDPLHSIDLSIDLALDDDALSALEKIYLFSRSKAIFHRIFITHALPSLLDNVSPKDAIEYVLPLLSGLAMDEDELVKEALAAELVPLVWWFFTHCQLIPDFPGQEGILHPSSSTISVQAFTPILGTLLLSSNPVIGRATRCAVVRLLARMKRVDDVNPTDPMTPLHLPAEIAQHDEDELEWVTGLFGRDERVMFRSEILQQVVIGMGRLDMDIDEQYDHNDLSQRHQQEAVDMAIIASGEEDVGEMPSTRSETEKENDFVNPYFPLLASPFSAPSSSNSSASQASTPSSSSFSFSPPQPRAVEYATQDHSVAPMTIDDGWVPSAPRPSHRTLPHARDSTPWSSPTLSDSAPLSSPQDSATDSRHFHPDDSGQRGHSLPEGSQLSYEYGSEEGEPDEQAAIGRLSSMSLMAAVAASGCLGEETEAFVAEVERVGRDPIYWVRREASFALGALAKVVPQEIVICSLLPLFDSLSKDSAWHVRHSALSALPAVLSRLPSKKRHSLALDTLLNLSTDDSATVRSGALEALGEVLYTFHEDEDGPPARLLDLFLGRKEDRRVRDEQQSSSDSPPSSTGGTSTDTLLESFYSDPERPLVCAFNFPAVALTLGRDRWPELRDVYLDIASDRTFKVRRTLAASLGELAKIIGEENAQRDLVGVWWDCVRSEEEEVRVKALECVGDFVLVLGSDFGADIIQRTVDLWDKGVFKSWREREAVAKTLLSLATSSGGDKAPSAVRALQMRAMEDRVAAVRQIAVTLLPEIWLYCSNRADVLAELRGALKGLATSTVYRSRMTFVACLYALVAPSDQSLPEIPLDDDLCKSVSDLADDSVVGVRIGVARLVGFVSGKLHPDSQSSISLFWNLLHRLSQDASHEVRAYIPDPSQLGQFIDLGPAGGTREKARLSNRLTFSRPPPGRRPSL